jgi:hypothetical protein
MRKLALTARLKPVFKTSFAFRGEWGFPWDHIRAVHIRDSVAMQEHSTIHEVRRVRFTVTDDV